MSALERRVRAAEGLLDGAAPVKGEADERLAEALDRVPRPILRKMIALADADGDEAAAVLAADASLLAAIQALMAVSDA